MCDRWELEHGSPNSPVVFTADETRGAHGLNYYAWTRRERRLATEREADRQARAKAAKLEREQEDEEFAKEEALRAEAEEIEAENIARGYKIMIGMAIVGGIALYAWIF